MVYFVLMTPYFQGIYISSDQLTIVSAADDVIENPLFNPFYWNWPRAPYVFPDLVITLGLRLFIHHDVIIATVMLVLQSAFVAAAGVAISASFADAGRGQPQAVALYGATMIVALIGTRYGWYAGAVIWPFVSYSHAGALDLTLVGFYALTRNLYAPTARPPLFWLSMLLTTLAYCSDKIAIVFFLPSATLYGLMRIRHSGSRPFIAFAAVQVVSIFAVIMLDHTFNFQIMETNTLGNLPTHFVHVIDFIMTQRISFRLFMVSMLAAIVAAFIHSSVRLFRWQDQNRNDGALTFLLCSSSLINTILLFWLWSTDEPAYTRYGVMIQFAGPISSTYLLLLQPLRRATDARLSVPVFCAILVSAAATWQGTRDPFDMIAVQDRRGAELQACVAKNGLHSGYAGYWSARQLSSSTDWTVQVDQFAPSEPVPFFWGSDVAWFYNRLRGGGENHHDFVVMDGLPETQIVADYGRPDEITDCGTHRVAIYRGAERLENKVDHHLAFVLSIETVADHLPRRILNRIDDGKLAFGVDGLSSLVGHREPGSITLSSEDGPGYGLFGPWIQLSAGTYRVAIAFTCSGDVTGTSFEVAAGDQHQRVIGWHFEDHPAVCNGEIQHATMSFDGPLSMVEVRTYYGGQGELSVSDVTMGRDAGGP